MLLCGACKVATACNQRYSLLQLTQATSQPLQHCSFIPHSKQLLPFDSSQSGPALVLQPAFVLPSLSRFPAFIWRAWHPPSLALLTHLQRCGCNLAAPSPAPVGTGRSKACWGTSASVLEGRQQLESKQAPSSGGTSRPAGWLTATNQLC